MLSQILLSPRAAAGAASDRRTNTKSGGEVMKVHSLLGILLLALLPGVALAQAADFQLPEPGVLELLGLAAVAAVVVRIRNRRK